MNPSTEEALVVHRALLEAYGEHVWSPHDPVATLISTIISQNTNDTNRDVAFERLRERFPTWEQVRDAREEAIVEAIRPAGLGPTKAPRIQSALHRITERTGAISLDFLHDLPTEEARGWLIDLPGVGPKTAAIVLCFALGRAAFPVDTHVHRVSQRLGLIPEGTSRERAHVLLEALLPERIYYSFHLNLIAHGRAICHSRNPDCGACILREVCDYYGSLVEEGEDT